MTARKRSIPRVEFRRALADWGMGRVHGDEVVALARAMPIHWGGRWRLLRETDISSFRVRGYQEADRAYTLHSDAYDRIVRDRRLGNPWFVSFAAEDAGAASEPPVASTLAMRTYGTTGCLTRVRTFARVRSWLDVVALRLADPDVDHALREEREAGQRVGCSPFDPRTVGDRPWPYSVLREDPSGGAYLRGRRGDLLEEWLGAVYSQHGHHGFELADALCAAHLETSWGTANEPLDILARAGWIRRGEMRLRWAHTAMHGTPKYGARAVGAKITFAGWENSTCYVWYPTGKPEAEAFLSRKRSAA